MKTYLYLAHTDTVVATPTAARTIRMRVCVMVARRAALDRLCAMVAGTLAARPDALPKGECDFDQLNAACIALGGALGGEVS